MKLDGGRIASQVTQGRKKNLLQPRFLRNPHKLRREKEPHRQTGGLLLIPSSKITPRQEEEDIVKPLNLSGKAGESSLLRESQPGSPSHAARQDERVKLRTHQRGA